MFEPDLLHGQVVIVTGGGTGLGFAMACRLAALGARLFLVSRKEARLREAAATITAAGGTCTYGVADVRDAAAVEAAVDEAARQLGPVTALINNAAGNFLARTETLSANAFAAVVGIVLQGTFNCTMAVGRRWIAADQPGAVLNIVATYAESGSGFVVPSACAKAGVLAMTRSLALEWARHRIRVNAIAPGPFPTENAWAALLPRSGDAERFEAAHPMKRYGRPEELANLAAYLLSPAAEYINAECITIDGGQRYRQSGFNHLVDWPDEAWAELDAKRRRARTEEA